MSVAGDEDRIWCNRLIGWLVWFYGISTFVGNLMPNPFLFQTIQFSIRTQFKCKYSLIVKNISISSYSV